VAVNGNDGGPGTLEDPFATLGKALSVVQSGEVIHMLAGTHNLNGASFTLDKPLTLQGDGPGSVLTNGKTFTIDTGDLTIQDLAFKSFAHSAYGDSLFELASGAQIEWLTVQRVQVEDVASFLWGRNFGGSFMHVLIRDCTLTDIVSSYRAVGIGVYTSGTMSDITITGNTVTNIGTTDPIRDVECIQIGENGMEAEYVTITDNLIDGLTGGTQEYNSYHPGGRGINAYGTYIVIDGNEVRNVNQAPGHNGIYIKGSYSQITNNTIWRGGSVSEGSGDLTIKGEESVGNLIEGNSVTSDATGGGIPIYTKGAVTIRDNYVRHTSAGLGIYSYELEGRHIDVFNNYIEVYGRAVTISNAGSGEVAFNDFVSYVGSPTGVLKLISGNVDYHDNYECLGWDCTD